MNKIFIAQVSVQPSTPQAGQISISVEQILLGSAILIGGATVGVVKWFVSRSIREYERTIKDLKEEIEEIKGSLHNHQRTSDSARAEIDRRFIELNSKFVFQEDYINHQTASDLKIDAVHRRLDEMMAILLKK